MKPKKWSRTDQVVLEGLLWALPVVALVRVGLDGVAALRGRPLEATGYLPDELVRGSGVVTGQLRGTVLVQDPTASQYGWDLVPSVVLLVLSVIAARLLLGLARSLRSGDPFTQRNAGRLRWLGILLLVGGMFVPSMQAIAFEGVIDPLLPGPPTGPSQGLDFTPIVIGMLVFFLAEVFGRGARMREDVEGLV